MHIVSHGKWTAIDKRWNLDSLGYKDEVTEWMLDSAFALHWRCEAILVHDAAASRRYPLTCCGSGKQKPWMKDGRYKHRWNRYSKPPCSGHGTCTPKGCECSKGHVGKFCGVAKSEAVALLPGFTTDVPMHSATGNTFVVIATAATWKGGQA